MNNATMKSIGKWLYGIPFIVFGLMHFMKSGMLKMYIPSFLPVPVLWVFLTGIALILAGVALLIGKKAHLALLLLGIMLMLFVLLIHIPGLFNEQMRQVAIGNMLKDLALAGAAFYLSGDLED
jgi:uncharacterized membrane protein YphA (DoxX/SURF4 family)